MRFVVIVQKGLDARAFGPFRSFRSADGNAKAWDGFVLPLEPADAPEPWNPIEPTSPQKGRDHG